ncbi:hypothetical protein CERSUDRAFT_113200 [Gelatoporia subvermispora B]|uniref:Uncharacterized protein n=1 Tax=Ceriporiopsis subvermispora (strain B) TaxID=914234 RepID=M2PNP8_CERS8|nr:hypothetical protein CERSUDRAFT_113200 [Gelatoporia subvermispora B]
MRVSGGTYVRSIVHNLCHVHDLGSAVHAATLQRLRQRNSALVPTGGSDWACVPSLPWQVFEKARKDLGEPMSMNGSSRSNRWLIRTRSLRGSTYGRIAIAGAPLSSEYKCIDKCIVSLTSGSSLSIFAHADGFFTAATRTRTRAG